MIVGLVMIILIIVESKTMLDLNFPDRKSFTTNLRKKTAHLTEILNNNQLPVHETRIRDPYGKFTLGGIATIDNGAPPILQERLARFRRAFFTVGAGGYLPIEEKKFEHSWDMASVNLMTEDIYHGSNRAIVDWGALEKREGGKSFIDDIYFQEKRQEGHELRLDDFHVVEIRLSGWAFDNINKSAETTKVYVILTKKNVEVTIPTIKTIRPGIAIITKNTKYFRSGFISRFHASLLESGRYSLALRITRDDQASYFEHSLKYSLDVVSTPVNDHFGQLKYLGNFENKYLYLVDSALSRAYLAKTCIPGNDRVHANETIMRADFTPGAVIVENLNPSQKKICNTLNNPLRPVRILNDSGRLVDLEKVDGPGVLVLNDNYYQGWHAYNRLTGDRLSIQPANLTFRAIILDREEPYQISFQYEPSWRGICYFWMSMGGVTLFSLFFFAYRVMRKSRTHEKP